MSRVLVIGIDALDTETLSNLKHDLPNFRKLMEKYPELKFDGVSPPDSPTSWASIYTGLNPARHGIVLFVDPIGKATTMLTKDVDDSTIRGKTFWDIAGKFGKKVCIAPHLLGYPVWPVNGVMVGRSGITKDVQSFPKEFSERYNLSQFGWKLDNFPGKNKTKYLESVKEQIRNEFEFGFKLFKEDNWDLFFISFGELDVIQYAFWNFHDEKDPSYPGNDNPYKNIIKDFYLIFDEILGKFLSSVESDVVTMVVSDHGIGSRPVKLLNINEFLRSKGLLILKQEYTNKKSFNYFAYRGIKFVKKTVLDTVNRYDFGNFAALMLRAFPSGKKLYTAQQHIDWDNTIAYLMDQSGIKVYPYGGIDIKKEKIGDINQYERTRDLLIKDLYAVKDPLTGENIFNWICKREELYSGTYLDRYPDIVFELKGDFGAGTNTPADFFGKSLSHNIVPGCHKQHNATFLISDLKEKRIKKKNMDLMDVAPTILDILGIDCKEFDFDGESIL